jgi:beta-mannosidase
VRLPILPSPIAQALTYLSMLGSALELAADISQRRSRNEFALFVWQLGEVWPTGGWGSLEYGPAPGFTAGQVVGGRWKPIHHMYAQHLYRDTVLLCGKDGACLLRHDGALAGVAGKAALSVVHMATGQSQALSSWSFELPIGPGASQWYCAASAQTTDYAAPACRSWADAVAPLGCAADLSDCVLSVSVYDANGNVLDAHTVLLTAPARMRLPAAAVTATMGAVRADGTTPVTLRHAVTMRSHSHSTMANMLPISIANKHCLLEH